MIEILTVLLDERRRQGKGRRAHRRRSDPVSMRAGGSVRVNAIGYSRAGTGVFRIPIASSAPGWCPRVGVAERGVVGRTFYRYDNPVSVSGQCRRCSAFSREEFE
ncbi:MAG: hypothetical protein RLW61_17260 [Gammaproteobacteria bacterium]|jgi:hypothetical protein